MAPNRTLIRGKWRLPILLCLADGPLRLSELRKALPNASKKVLVDNLHGLERLDVIERVDLSTRVRRVEYALSEMSRDKVLRLLSALQGLQIGGEPALRPVDNDADIDSERSARNDAFCSGCERIQYEVKRDFINK